MTTQLPPIYRDCRRLLVHTEQMVMRFARYHKYTVGTELRQGAMTIMRTVNQAVRDRPHQVQHVQSLVWRVDEYKLTLQLAMDVGAFFHSVKGSQSKVSPSFHAFEQAANLAATIGKQCGGWRQALARHQRAEQVTPVEMSAEAVGHAAGSVPGAGLQPLPQVVAHPASLSGWRGPVWFVPVSEA